MFSVDLPRSAATRSRTAIAAWSATTGIAITTVRESDTLVALIAERAAPEALVALDIPIEGCAQLGPERPRRRVDDKLSRVGIPLLPSSKAGPRSAVLRDRLRAARPDLRIVESYPYAVLRVLWALHAAHEASAWSWNARVGNEPGSILTLAPAWLRHAFENA